MAVLGTPSLPPSMDMDPPFHIPRLHPELNLALHLILSIPTPTRRRCRTQICNISSSHHDHPMECHIRHAMDLPIHPILSFPYSLAALCLAAQCRMAYRQMQTLNRHRGSRLIHPKTKKSHLAHETSTLPKHPTLLLETTRRRLASFLSHVRWMC